MGSKDSDTMSDDELRALHQSIEQLNAVNRKNLIENVTPMSDSCKSAKRRRVKATSADVQTQTPKKSKKKKISLSEGVVDESDNQIDEILDEIASRKNLTANNVKNLLRSIIANESVQELVKCSLTADAKLPFEPKLTRSKTKEWLETQNISWVSTKKLSDTHILIEEELSEDSSDDEYRPCEDDVENQSDEESFVSSQASDIGSPLSASAAKYCSNSTENDYFKRPLPIQQSNEQDLIGSRTRSKLPLNDTPLEHLELAFMPPDISTDMYDSDCDNEEWRNFLKEFMCPPARTTSENQDDEEADPEYNILEEDEEVDDEELRADRTVQITKKEVRELLSELFEEGFSSSDEETRDGGLRQTNLQPENPDNLQTTVSEVVTPVDQTSSELSKATAKPMGIVQPLPPNPSSGLSFTISFPTIDHAPIEVCPAPGTVPEATASPAHGFEISPMSPESKLILEDQLRKHVQLLTQMHLITTQETELAEVAQKCRSMLHELQPFNQQLNILNLHEAIYLVSTWEASATKIPPDQLRRFQRTIVDSGPRRKFVNRAAIHPDRYPFNPRMVELMADSCVFMYPELLPKIAIFEIEHGPCIPSSHEEQLIAMGLEQFTPYCQQLLAGTKSAIHNLVRSMISNFMLPHWTARQIAGRIKRLSISKAPNPVKYYLEHKVAPPVHHHVQPLLRVCKLRDIPPNLLPERWREMMVMFEARCHRRSMDIVSLSKETTTTKAIDPSFCLTSLTPVSHQKPKKRKRRIQRNAAVGNMQELVEPTNSSSDEQPNTLQIPQLSPRRSLQVDDFQPQHGSPTHTSSPVISDKGNTSVRNHERDIPEPPGSVVDSPPQDSPKGSKNDDSSVAEDDSDDEEALLSSSAPSLLSSLSSNSSHTGPPSHPAKRYVVIQRENGSSDQVVHVWGPLNDKPLSYQVRTAADQSAQSNQNGGNASCGNNAVSSTNTPLEVGTTSGSGPSRTGAGADGGDDGDKPPSSPSLNTVADDVTAEDEEEEDDSINMDSLNTTPLRPQSAPVKNRSPGHRNVRHQRNARRILDSWMTDDSASVNNDAYALGYFAKVKNQLEQENPNAFKDFVNTLGHFQSSTNSISELYKKMESILDSYPDLMDEFVLFLSPEAAAQCGLQFQHFLYVRMRDFFTKLKVHFKDSPSQLKRALKALQQIESSTEPSIADIKNAILPLLRGNNYLTQIFLQLFVDDAPPSSDSGDFEEVNIEQVQSGDEFENVTISDSTANLRDSDSKAAKRNGSKGMAKNKSKGKSWKKS